MKKIPDPGKFSVSPLYKRASVKLMHMVVRPSGGRTNHVPGVYVFDDMYLRFYK